MDQKRPCCTTTCGGNAASTASSESVSISCIGTSSGFRSAWIAAAAIVITATCAGCVTRPRFDGSIQKLSNPEISVVRAVAHYSSAGIIVDGDVRRPNGFAGTVPGFLRVEGRDVSGNVIVATQAKWGEFKSRRFRLAYFRAFLPASETASIASIDVEPITSTTN